MATDALVSLDDYRAITGDAATADDLVPSRLAMAQTEVAEYLGRGLELAERTETLPMFRDGRSYPSCTPILSVSMPTGIILDGVSVLGGLSMLGEQDMLVNNTQTIWPYGRVTVTYSGGWTAETLPQRIRRGICRLAQLSGVQSGNLVGARSVRTLDVAVDFGSAAEGTPDAVRGAVLRDLIGWRYTPMLP